MRNLTVSFAFSLSLGLFSLSIMSAPLQAETIGQALAGAYNNNPEIRAEQARLRATDEDVARARSGYRPNISLNADTSSRYTDTKPSALTDGRSHPHGYSVTLNQPIFRGFRTMNGIAQARASVEAGRYNLKLVEQNVLFAGVSAYMNVIRERAILRLQDNNLRVLSQQLKATQDRFTVGEVTKTDVAQARARRSSAVSEVNLAKANLKAARAEYKRVIGFAPRNLRTPARLRRRLPRSLPRAIEIGLSEHPSILSAVQAEKAARHAVNLIRGERLPEVNLQAEYQQRFDTNRFIDENETASITARATVPLYQSGEVSARIRQSKQVVMQRRAEIEQARRRVRAEIVSAWSGLQAAIAQIDANNAQVTANRTALSGVREEEKVGQRTVLDVLDAEQDLLNSEATLVSTKRDLAVAEYQLLAAIGRLSANELNLPVETYMPEDHYHQVNRKWHGERVDEPDLDQQTVVQWGNIRIHRD